MFLRSSVRRPHDGPTEITVCRERDNFQETLVSDCDVNRILPQLSVTSAGCWCWIDGSRKKSTCTPAWDADSMSPAWDDNFRVRTCTDDPCHSTLPRPRTKKHQRRRHRTPHILENFGSHRPRGLILSTPWTRTSESGHGYGTAEGGVGT